jgi:TATA-box binding protein (TBP) (component of TFIID and TFIIIB)
MFNSNGIEYQAFHSDKVQEQYKEKESEPEQVIDVFALIEQKRKTFVPKPRITHLSVSTQSAKATMSQALDLRKVAEIIYRAIEDNIVDEKRVDFSIVGVEYKPGDICIGPIKKRTMKANGKGKQFPNNCTVLIRSPMGTGRTINLKMFRNGSISMTGCKVKEDGIAAIKILEKFLIKQRELFTSSAEAKKFRIQNFQVTMINSNYEVGFPVERDRLYKLICNQYPEILVEYDPSKYSGVKLSFFYNTVKETQDGTCQCTKFGANKICNPKAKSSTDGKSVGNCKVVTVAVFQSGKIINTGGRNMEQTLAAYEFTNHIIKKHAKEIVRISILDLKN